VARILLPFILGVMAVIFLSWLLGELLRQRRK
jgi:hypothetical protein